MLGRRATSNENRKLRLFDMYEGFKSLTARCCVCCGDTNGVLYDDSRSFSALNQFMRDSRSVFDTKKCFKPLCGQTASVSLSVFL